MLYGKLDHLAYLSLIFFSFPRKSPGIKHIVFLHDWLQQADDDANTSRDNDNHRKKVDGNEQEEEEALAKTPTFV